MTKISKYNEQRISELAQSMYTLHLAASMEEALQRAREIVLGNKAGKNEQTVNDLIGTEEQPKEP